MHKIAHLIGRKLPYFPGKDRLVRFFCNPNRYENNVDGGIDFSVPYFNRIWTGNTGNYIDWGIYVYGGLEKALIAQMLTEAERISATCLVDVGANVGSFCLPFAEKMQVMAFEPLRENLDKLATHVSENGLDDWVTAKMVGLSDFTGEMSLRYSDTHVNQGIASFDVENPVFNRALNVPVARLDDLVFPLGESLLLKIDVEGHEERVLAGAANLLKSNRITMYLETTNQALLDRLHRAGWSRRSVKIKEGSLWDTQATLTEHHILRNWAGDGEPTTGLAN